uniref:Class II aldolase/adducin N-terminal domain-containing protein n=1 Tax=Timema tahoe TaxID=61484 RepID=A0A7R9FG64_9NEOP|nr:unnamed protein product [Timema tahoe]
MQDMREMERRKRVEMIMNSRLFREELERIIEIQMKDGSGPSGSNCVVPINDIRGVESMGYAKGEKILRCKLAAVYRLVDLYGWTQGVNNQITARLNQDQEHFIINPFGMLYHEITASSLVKIDMQGNIVEPGTTNFSVNVSSFMLHSAIHAARPDIKCIIHVHTPSVLAVCKAFITIVSSLKSGLLPLCQEAIVIGEVLFLQNHGAVCCGETIKLMPIGIENLVLVSDEARKHVYEAARRAPDSVPKHTESSDVAPATLKKERQWRIGGVEFEALMRMLDNSGFRTGYIYRHPLVKGDPPRPRNDVEVPPAVSSLGYLLEEEEMYRSGNWKKYMDGRKTHDRTRWLNSPNVYQKVEILETGTPDPKKITKWVADGSPTHSSTPVKIESALMFVPKGTNPREFKKLQQQIKDNRRADKITSGPQSHILEGVSWEEAKKLQDANVTQTGDQVILVGAASKGIIQRGFQHNAMVYKTPYAKNPFDTITDEELEEYKKVIERKQKGESCKTQLLTENYNNFTRIHFLFIYIYFLL